MVSFQKDVKNNSRQWITWGIFAACLATIAGLTVLGVYLTRRRQQRKSSKGLETMMQEIPFFKTQELV